MRKVSITKLFVYYFNRKETRTVDDVRSCTETIKYGVFVASRSLVAF